ncbi:MAG TPA: C4-type zinc ribbon domain-containing protein [Actinomycetales bacterium]|nr:C4-type zinc ribbon domain-containing protein [Actinomycetales bacterium]
MTTANALDQVRLLDVQALDTRLNQIDHRRRNLPEHAQLTEAQRRADSVRDQLIAAQTEAGDITRELAKAEADVELVRQRAARNQSRLDAGAGSAKDMQALQHELESLARRQSDLEDVELEVMERSELAQATVARLEAEQREVTEAVEKLTQARDAAVSELDAEAERVRAEREEIASGLDQGLMALYEKVREASGGVGAAALKGGRCEGCRLQLTPIDLNRIRAASPDEIVRCEECRRILVRTPDSGL